MKSEIKSSKASKYDKHDIDAISVQDNIPKLKMPKFVIFYIVSYIPNWIIISIIWQQFDTYIDFREFLIVLTISSLAFPLEYTLYLFISPYLFDIYLSIQERKLNMDTGVTTEIAEITLRGYGKVLPCCYNAARLGDRYCMCGRIILDSLIEFIND